MALDDVFNKEYWTGRKSHREEVLQRLEEFLKERSRESLEKLMKALWASEAYDVNRAIENRIIKKGYSFEDIAKKLELVRSSPAKLLEQDIPSFGPASITEILFCIAPEKYPIFNKRAKAGLKALGYGDFEKVQRLTASTYQDFTMALEKMYADLKAIKGEIEERAGLNIPKFDFVDGILNLLYEGKLSISEIRELRRQAVLKAKIDKAVMNYALSSIQGAVKQYFYWLGKGDSEERAIEKAVNYAAGVINASGVLSDPKKHQALVTALEAMADLAKGMTELLRELS